VKVWVLGSGSGGNALLLEADGARILVDAGFGTRTIAARLRAIGVAPASIEACIITHEHGDHVRGAAAAARRWGWPLYASNGTAESRELGRARVTRFAAGDGLALSRMDVRTAPTPHDAADPIALVVTVRSTGARTGICYDIGHVNSFVREVCRDVDILVVESNHDEGMLRAGPYPPWLRQRIASDSGHLSNRAAGELVCESAPGRLAHLVLAHLSHVNNTPQVARGTVGRAIARTKFRGRLCTAVQDGVVGPFAPSGRRADQPLQYALW
jgi:phosphoribosyl 1,2-cyclic phosphodiesterase